MTSASQLEFIPMTPLYVEGFWKVLDDVAREGVWLELTTAPAIDVLRKHVNEDIATGNPFYIAIGAGKVVGWCTIICETRPFRTHRGKVVMGIDTAFRRQGLGQQLLQRSIDHAEAIGIGRIELQVYAHNTGGKALYEKLGFAVEGVHRMTRVFEGRYFDTIAMARLNHNMLSQNLASR